MESAPGRGSFNDLCPVETQRGVDGRGNVFHIDRALHVPPRFDYFFAELVRLADHAATLDAATRKQTGVGVLIMVGPRVEFSSPGVLPNSPKQTIMVSSSNERPCTRCPMLPSSGAGVALRLSHPAVFKYPAGSTGIEDPTTTEARHGGGSLFGRAPALFHSFDKFLNETE